MAPRNVLTCFLTLVLASSAATGEPESIIYAKILLPLEDVGEGPRIDMEPWIARKLKAAGQSELRAVTGGVRRQEAGEERAELRDAKDGDKFYACQTFADPVDRPEPGMVTASLFHLSPAGHVKTVALREFMDADSRDELERHDLRMPTAAGSRVFGVLPYQRAFVALLAGPPVSVTDIEQSAPSPPVGSLDSLLKGIKEPTVEDVLKIFKRAEFKDEDDVRAAIKAAAGSPASVSYVHLAWSAQSEFRKRDFAKFVLSKKRENLATPATVHFIDCSLVTKDYSALYDLPGWDRKKDGPAGWGEVLWLNNGRVVHFERIDRFATTDELIAKTEELFPPADQALIADPIVEARFRLAIKKPEGELTRADLEREAWRLDFRFTEITDDGLKDVAKLKGIQELLFSSHAKITDAGLKELAKLSQLEGLSLAGTGITDAGLKEVAKLKNLEGLNLQKTMVSAAGLAELQKLLPNCKMLHSTAGAGQNGADSPATDVDLQPEANTKPELESKAPPR